PGGRIPHVDPFVRAKMRKTPADQGNANDRHERVHSLVGPLPDQNDHGRPRVAARGEDVRRQENRKTQDHDGKAHGSGSATSAAQLPGRSWTAAKNTSFQLAGFAFNVPMRCMKSAYFITPSGATV